MANVGVWSPIMVPREEAFDRETIEGVSDQVLQSCWKVIVPRFSEGLAFLRLQRNSFSLIS